MQTLCVFFLFDLQTHEVNKVSRATYEQAMVVWKCLIGGIPPTNLMVLSKSFNIFLNFCIFVRSGRYSFRENRFRFKDVIREKKAMIEGL